MSLISAGSISLDSTFKLYPIPLLIFGEFAVQYLCVDSRSFQSAYFDSLFSGRWSDGIKVCKKSVRFFILSRAVGSVPDP